jgi:hypothetical protein
VTEAIVNITDVEPTSERVLAETVKAGDTIFDVFGGKHTVRRVRVFKHVVHLFRSGRQPSSFEVGSTITVIRAVA